MGMYVSNPAAPVSYQTIGKPHRPGGRQHRVEYPGGAITHGPYRPIEVDREKGRGRPNGQGRRHPDLRGERDGRAQPGLHAPGRERLTSPPPNFTTERTGTTSVRDTLRIQIFFANEEGAYRNGTQAFYPEVFGGVPAVGDVILAPWLPPVNDASQQQGGFWEVVTRYFIPVEPYVPLVVRARSRLPHEIGIETNFKNGPRRLIRFYYVKSPNRRKAAGILRRSLRHSPGAGKARWSG